MIVPQRQVSSDKASRGVHPVIENRVARAGYPHDNMVMHDLDQESPAQQPRAKHRHGLRVPSFPGSIGIAARFEVVGERPNSVDPSSQARPVPRSGFLSILKETLGAGNVRRRSHPSRIS